MMKQLFFILLVMISCRCFSRPVLPVPDHIVIVILENHAYQQIMDSPDAPFINSLAVAANTALFTQSYATAYPSQPNYLDLFSGSNQGIIDNSFPAQAPFTTPNLASQLLEAGKTFSIYSEDLPYAGFNGESAGYYVRRHNPVANWIGNGTNQVPAETNQPFTAFPSDYSLLPTVCLVVPNLLNNMHDGSLSTGDQWIAAHLSGFIEWAKTNNSLFILTFDEDNKQYNNQIVTLFSGQMVKTGKYSNLINHYNILRTIQDMYQLPYAGHSATSAPITECWTAMDDGPNSQHIHFKTISFHPANQQLVIDISEEYLLNNLNLELIDLQGAIIKKLAVRSHQFTFKINVFGAGIYIYQLKYNNTVLKRGKFMIIN